MPPASPRSPAAAYRRLDATKIVATLSLLRQRIVERFAGRSLAAVAEDLLALAEKTQRRADDIAAPNLLLRLLGYAAIVAGFAAVGYIVWQVRLRAVNLEVFAVFQGVEAAINIVVVAGAAFFFVFTMEDRIKRRRALRALHEIRSIVHVIDMHQLTKDPSVALEPAKPTKSSPERTMSRFELTRYLDYCSEMLAMCGKLAALYAQSLPDPVVISAVNEIEQLTGNLSQKIWQKISILELGGSSARPLGDP